MTTNVVVAMVMIAGAPADKADLVMIPWVHLAAVTTHMAQAAEPVVV
jgi:hypothetical protein